MAVQTVHHRTIEAQIQQLQGEHDQVQLQLMQSELYIRMLQLRGSLSALRGLLPPPPQPPADPPTDPRD